MTPKEKSNMVFSSDQVMHMFKMMHNKLKEPPKKKRKVSEIEPNEELKQMFKAAVNKPKYSDSDTEYILLNSRNNSTLNEKLNRKCIPETVGEVLNEKDEIVPFKILLDSRTTATIIKNI
jgi:poly-D-alanine transfer protein DltD